MKRYGRLSDSELFFFEENIARALNIIYMIPVLSTWTDDPDILQQLTVVQDNALKIRKSLIARMNERRDEVRTK